MVNDRTEFTPLEQRVLRLVARGRTNRVIRGRLGITTDELAKTLSSLYRKTNIHQPKEPFTPWQVRGRLAAWGQYFFAAEGR